MQPAGRIRLPAPNGDVRTTCIVADHLPTDVPPGGGGEVAVDGCAVTVSVVFPRFGDLTWAALDMKARFGR
jgi:hypothetical protein